MEQLSNQDKKELFMKIREIYDNILRENQGNSWAQAIALSKQEEVAREKDGDWKICNNNGPLGITYSGKDEKGNNIVTLFGGKSKYNEYGYITGGISDEITQSFSEEELEEFLNLFFDMSNMEILSHFSQSNSFPSFEESSEISKSNLLYLNALDYLRQNGQKLRSTSCWVAYIGEDNIPLTNANTCEFEVADVVIDSDGNHNYTAISRFPAINDIAELVSTSIQSFPEIWESVRNGTYLTKQTPLQQRESELSALEAEERTISEAEALIDIQTAKEGQDIGEE